MAPVPGAEDQDVDQHLEDHPVTDPRPVTAQQMPVVALSLDPPKEYSRVSWCDCDRLRA
jgi:hypothetical protein